MSKKKNKWSFIDLDDSDFGTLENKNEHANYETNTNFTLSDLKNESSNLSNKKQINYEVNYDDILYDDENKKEIIKEFFVNDKKNKNLKPRATIKTYNEALKKQENLQKEISNGENVEDEKIKKFLSVKEKLDVKTNIYLKSSVVIKLRELEEKTNESRSSIINRLIEIALKKIDEEN